MGVELLDICPQLTDEALSYPYALRTYEEGKPRTESAAAVSQTNERVLAAHVATTNGSELAVAVAAAAICWHVPYAKRSGRSVGRSETADGVGGC